MKLLRIEGIKIAHNNTFRVILLLHFFLFVLLVYVVTKIDITIPGFDTKNLFVFPNVWGLFAWFASWFNLLFLGIIIIVLTGNEFSFRTTRLQITNGLGRNEFLFGKGILILLIALWGMFLVFITGLIVGLIFSSGINFHQIIENTNILLVYFIQAISYMVFGLFVAVLFRNNALSIMMYLLYFIMIEPIGRLFFPKSVRPWFPVKVMSGLTPVPEFLSMTSQTQIIDSGGRNQLDLSNIGLARHTLSPSASLLMALAYILVFMLLSFLLFRKRDL